MNSKPITSVAIKEVIWIQRLHQDVEEDVQKPTAIHINNQSAIWLIKNSQFHCRTKHIDFVYPFIREKYESGIILPTFVNRKEREADILTKALLSTKFEKLRKLWDIMTLPTFYFKNVQKVGVLKDCFITFCEYLHKVYLLVIEIAVVC